MAAEQRDWTSLSRDILAHILERFHAFDEYLLFGRVCKEFSLVVKGDKRWQELSNPRLPLLMAPSKDNPMNRRVLYNAVDNRLCGLQVALPYEGRFCGSSHGWVASFGSDMIIRLNNLVSGRCIELPRIFNDPPYEMSRTFPSLGPPDWIGKVILSENPDIVSSPENCVVGVLYEREGWLAFMRMSDDGWTYVDPRLTLLCYDLMFSDGYLYAISDQGKLIRVDLSIGSYVDKEEGEVIVPASFREQASRAYIVESPRGGMLMIRRFVDAIPPYEEGLYLTTRFEIFRLEGSHWVKITSLDDEIIFVGDSQSKCFPCAEFTGCKPNRIYFTDDCFEDYFLQGPTDVGLFNIEDGSVETTYPLNHFESRSMPPPIFIVPRLDDRLFLNW